MNKTLHIAPYCFVNALKNELVPNFIYLHVGVLIPILTEDGDEDESVNIVCVAMTWCRGSIVLSWVSSRTDTCWPDVICKSTMHCKVPNTFTLNMLAVHFGPKIEDFDMPIVIFSKLSTQPCEIY